MSSVTAGKGLKVEGGSPALAVTQGPARPLRPPEMGADPLGFWRLQNGKTLDSALLCFLPRLRGWENGVPFGSLPQISYLSLGLVGAPRMLSQPEAGPSLKLD